MYDVSANALINDLSEKFKKENIEVPENLKIYVKTGTHKEKAPDNNDWWYVRVAAVLRKIAIKGPIGVTHLSAEYGGKKDRGSSPYKAVRGSGSVARKAVQQLESLGYIKKEKKGRVVTGKGRSLLDNAAYKVMKKMVNDNPELNKYIIK